METPAMDQLTILQPCDSFMKQKNKNHIRNTLKRDVQTVIDTVVSERDFDKTQKPINKNKSADSLENKDLIFPLMLSGS